MLAFNYKISKLQILLIKFKKPTIYQVTAFTLLLPTNWRALASVTFLGVGFPRKGAGFRRSTRSLATRRPLALVT